MKARAIQPIPEGNGHKQFMPGESLDELDISLVQQYVNEGLATFLEKRNPPARRRKSGQGQDEVKNGNR